MADKRVIKASDIEAAGVKVEKVDYEIRKFDSKVYKHAPLDEQPIAIENQGIPSEHGDTEENLAEDEPQVELERFYDDQGELAGLKITCRCGEVIELEFTRDQDELPPEADNQVPPVQSITPEEQPEPEFQDAPEPENLDSQ